MTSPILTNPFAQLPRFLFRQTPSTMFMLVVLRLNWWLHCLPISKFSCARQYFEVWRRKDPRMLSALPLALLAGTFALTTTAVSSCSTPGHSQLNVRLKTLWSNSNDGGGWVGTNEFVITLGTGAPKEFRDLAPKEWYVRVDDNSVHLQRALAYLCSPFFFFALVLRTTRVISGTPSTLIGRQAVVWPTLQQTLI